MEIWKPIKGFKGAYAVSNLGRVKSLDRDCKRGGGSYRIVPGKILKPTLWARYWSVQLSKAGIVQRRRIHELVLSAFVGRCPTGQCCRHIDGNRDNNALSNLRWGSRKENEADKILHGTAIIGARNPNSKLTERQVRQILTSTKTQKEIAKELGITQACVSLIRTRQHWKHITDTLRGGLNGRQDTDE